MLNFEPVCLTLAFGLLFFQRGDYTVIVEASTGEARATLNQEADVPIKARLNLGKGIM